MHRQWKFMISIAVFLLTLPLEVVASESEHGEHEESHRHRHRLELFIGNTHEEGEDNFTSGLIYEYRLKQILGIGAFVEFSEKRFEKFGFPLFIHPYKGLRFVVAPGLVYEDEEDKFLFRTGVAYEFEFGRWSITPEFDIDFIDGDEALVFGVSFGWGF